MPETVRILEGGESKEEMYNENNLGNQSLGERPEKLRNIHMEKCKCRLCIVNNSDNWRSVDIVKYQNWL